MGGSAHGAGGPGDTGCCCRCDVAGGDSGGAAGASVVNHASGSAGVGNHAVMVLM